MRLYLRPDYEVIGYSYEADFHCIECTLARFPGKDDTKWEDREGNPVHAIFLGNLSEILLDYPKGHQLMCSCGEIIE